MNPQILNNPFTQVALPIMFTILVAAWINSRGIDGVHKAMDKGLDAVNHRIDDLRDSLRAEIGSLRGDMNRRFAEVNSRLDGIDKKLDDHGTRITRLEEQVSPFRGR
jgi:hypothetical protein